MAVSKKTVLDTIHRYIELVATGSSADVVALYADGATLEDPVGSEARTTREAIAEFYSALDGLQQEARIIHLRVAGNEAAFAFELVTTVGEQKLTIAPVDVMTFDDEGRITSMRAFWSEDDMVWS